MPIFVLLFLIVTICPALSQPAPVRQQLAPASGDAPAAAPPPQPSEPAPAESAPAPAEPSVVEKLGNMIKESVDNMSSTLKGTQQSIQDMNKSIGDMNKGAADTLTRLPVTGFANGRGVCIRAPNGAPDCRAASDKLCQEKGFKSGSSLEIQTAENCNPRVYVPGYQRKDGDCRTDNYVTRAACN